MLLKKTVRKAELDFLYRNTNNGGLSNISRFLKLSKYFFPDHNEK